MFQYRTFRPEHVADPKLRIVLRGMDDNVAGLFGWVRSLAGDDPNSVVLNESVVVSTGGETNLASLVIHPASGPVLVGISATRDHSDTGSGASHTLRLYRGTDLLHTWFWDFVQIDPGIIVPSTRRHPMDFTTLDPAPLGATSYRWSFQTSEGNPVTIALRAFAVET